MSATHHGLLIHIIFSTKLRYPLLADEWRDDLFAYIGGTAKDHKATILASGGIEDHVHPENKGTRRLESRIDATCIRATVAPTVASRLSHIFHPYLGLASQAIACRRYATEKRR